MKTKIIIIAALVALTGCTSTTYQAPNGVKFSRTSLLNKQSIGKVTFNPSTGELSMEGYSNEQTETAAAVAGAVAKALTPAIPVAK
jgi:hypothetical protein